MSTPTVSQAHNRLDLATRDLAWAQTHTQAAMYELMACHDFPRDDVLEALAGIASARRDMEYAANALATAAREAGITWTEIGDALGVSRQAAQQRYKTPEA